jgi:sn-1 stearoyl-lipid 9-desaturase
MTHDPGGFHLFTDHLLSMGTPASVAAWFFGSYLYLGLGITLGYHRLLTHKALSVPRWLMYVICFGGYMCLMGSPVVWVAVHRLHHQKSDLPGDPHSPRDGFKHALYGWMMDMQSVQSDEELRAQCKDLMKDPVFRWLGSSHAPQQAMMCLGACIAVRLLILVFFGMGALLANLLATFMVFWSTQLVNAVCHLPGWGYQSHEDSKDDSLNVWWVAILSLGEGWHNNHHAMPTSARHGMAWWEFDVTWYTTVILEKLGLANRVVRPKRLHSVPVPVTADGDEPHEVVPIAAVNKKKPARVKK